MQGNYYHSHPQRGGHSNGYQNNYPDRNYGRGNNNTRYTTKPAAGNAVNRVTLKQPYLNQIISKVKTVEGRINSGQFRNIRAGSHIIFFNGGTEVECKIIAKRPYNSFRDMLESEGVKKCLPNVNSVDEGARVYDSIPSFTQRANQNGVVALELEVIEQPTLPPRKLTMPVIQVTVQPPKPEQKAAPVESREPAKKRAREEEKQDIRPEIAAVEEKKIVRPRVEEARTEPDTKRRKTSHTTETEEKK
ncbi:MAG: ASCH domain-containing protein [Parachlamydia sp.]|jgi:ASC-1-like (ASCH) protein|nr:ASCH domain-containing protein [Parachlamydia sp.]